jgi:hypothetical protein
VEGDDEGEEKREEKEERGMGKEVDEEELSQDLVDFASGEVGGGGRGRRERTQVVLEEVRVVEEVMREKGRTKERRITENRQMLVEDGRETRGQKRKRVEIVEIQEEEKGEGEGEDEGQELLKSQKKAETASAWKNLWMASSPKTVARESQTSQNSGKTSVMFLATGGSFFSTKYSAATSQDQG